MTTSLVIILFFAAGLLTGFLNIFPEEIDGGNLSKYALYLLMFFVGISIGATKDFLYAIKQHGIRLILVPAATIAGTFAGVALIHFFTTNLLFAESLAVGAGFGYYSLSSIIISELHSESLGVTALLANIMRELITLLFAPIMVLWFGKLSPISSGGATSMDTTLPIICRTSGSDFALLSVFHGIVLTVLVPVLVTFILSLIG
ncbi:MAG TPA: lysine exporter LysO family protein [Bacteroidales bacterium]|nr:lysine exporter LysO family protein [Bacteroidales bacterium]